MLGKYGFVFICICCCFLCVCGYKDTDIGAIKYFIHYFGKCIDSDIWSSKAKYIFTTIPSGHVAFFLFILAKADLTSGFNSTGTFMYLCIIGFSPCCHVNGRVG